MPAYRSLSRAASAILESCASATSTRGSSWEASATISLWPGSAWTAPRIWRGICSAPPPREAQRPETTPPTTYSGWNRPFLHPGIQPGPAVGGVQAGELLERQERFDRRVAGFLQFPLPGGLHLDAVPVQGAHQLLRGVRVQRGGIQQLPQLGGQRFQLGRAVAQGRPGAEVVRQDLLMQFLAPRHTGVLHFRRDHGAGGLGGEQELEALPAVVAGAFDAGPPAWLRASCWAAYSGAEVLGGVAGRSAQAGIIKQGALVGRRGRRLQRAGRLAAHRPGSVSPRSARTRCGR